MDFNAEDWVFERSSGYAGYRNVKTANWIYLDEYNKLVNCTSKSTNDKEEQHTLN